MPVPGEWTLAAATAALPEVRKILQEARGHLARMEEVGEHLQDLRLLHGEQVLAPASPGHAEFRDLWQQYRAARQDLEQDLLSLGQMGVEVKDVAQGLVDFRGQVADRPAYLCWKAPEEAIQWWHPLDEGFQGRRRLPGS